MNIGLFSDCYLPTKNGVTTAIVQAKQELERRGHMVVVLTVAYPADDPTGSWNRGFSRFLASASRPADPGGGPRAASILGPHHNIYRFPSLPFRSDIELRLGFARQAAINHIVAQEQLDLIHTHTEFSLGWGGRRAARAAGLPLVHTLHTFYPDYRHYLPLGQLLPKRAVRRWLAGFLGGYDTVICPSTKMQDYVASIRPALPAAVIGNGAARARFDPARVTADEQARVWAELGIGPDDRVILYVGRLAPEKRVLALFEALVPLLRTHANYRVIFIGSGPLRAELAHAIQAAGLAAQARLVGLVAWERIAAVYAVAHAFATASLSEVHPMTLIEAAMCGLPVVARQDVSFVDLVKDGYNGYLVDSDREIAGQLTEILRDEAVRRALAHNARILSEQFTVQKHADKLEALYRQVMTYRQESDQ